MYFIYFFSYYYMCVCSNRFRLIHTAICSRERMDNLYMKKKNYYFIKPSPVYRTGHHCKNAISTRIINTSAKRPAVAATRRSARAAVAGPPRMRPRLRARCYRATWRPVTRPAGPATRPISCRRPGRPSSTASSSWPSVVELLVLPSCDVCAETKTKYKQKKKLMRKTEETYNNICARIQSSGVQRQCPGGIRL